MIFVFITTIFLTLYINILALPTQNYYPEKLENINKFILILYKNMKSKNHSTMKTKNNLAKTANSTNHFSGLNLLYS